MNKMLEEGLDSDDALDLETLTRFCEKFKVRFVRADITHEQGFREPIYFFSDELGGYAIDGIRGSLNQYP